MVPWMNIEIEESPSASLSLLYNKKRPPARLLRLKKSTVPILRLSWPPSLSSTRSFGDRINKTYCSLQKPCRISRWFKPLEPWVIATHARKERPTCTSMKIKVKTGCQDLASLIYYLFFCFIFSIYTWLMVRGMHSDGRRWTFGCVHLFVTSCEVAFCFTLYVFVGGCKICHQDWVWEAGADAVKEMSFFIFFRSQDYPLYSFSLFVCSLEITINL